MKQFEVKQFEVKQLCSISCWYIGRGTNDYMHRDGEIVHNAAEYWLTCEQAQAVLDKYQPHVWEHGDVFKNHMYTLIYLEPFGGPVVVNLSTAGGSATFDVQMRPEAEPIFLFNVRDKL